MNESLIMDRCRKCGRIIYENFRKKRQILRCDKCREEVDKDLNHEQNKPFSYYFDWYIKWEKKFQSKQLMMILLVVLVVLVACGFSESSQGIPLLFQFYLLVFYKMEKRKEKSEQDIRTKEQKDIDFYKAYF